MLSENPHKPELPVELDMVVMIEVPMVEHISVMKPAVRPING